MNPKCSVCSRNINNNKLHKAIPCLSCFTLIHRKCSQISLYDLNNNAEKLNNWECLACQREKYPFACVQEESILEECFDSNLICACRNTEIPAISRNMRFTAQKIHGKDTNMDFINMLDDCCTLRVKFNYFEVHTFHKLCLNFKNKQNIPFSIYHTNI